jgi:oxygen-independent coproporphyrinogen-3 oxidase
LNTVATSPLAVYIHWPYCDRICPYCDFNVYKNKGADTDLLQAIVQDLSIWRVKTGPRQVLSIHFGGGTPSLLSANDIETLIEAVKRLWGFETGTEIALEANPSNLDEGKWQDYHRAGINRLSLGVQTFDDKALSFLGRDHDAEMARKALTVAKKVFPSVSADLIFGWAGQTEADLMTDLEALLSVDPNHISTYQLTVEDGTAFAKAESRGLQKAVDADKSADFFDAVIHALTQNGFDHYEVSNFAKTGHKSEHNLSYWRGYDYVGVGPGAHGRLTHDGVKFATISAMRPSTYIQKIVELGTGLIENDALSSLEQAEEYVLMALRIDEGLSLNRYAEISAVPLESTKYVPLIDEGFLMLKNDRLIATPKGRFVLNRLCETLLT